MAKIIKVLNHNALIVHDAQSSRALLLLGKGIGFGRRINEQLEIGKAEGCSVYELQQKTSKGETRDVLLQHGSALSGDQCRDRGAG